MRAQLNQLCIIASITWKAIVVRAFIWLRSNLFAFPAEFELYIRVKHWPDSNTKLIRSPKVAKLGAFFQHWLNCSSHIQSSHEPDRGLGGSILSRNGLWPEFVFVYLYFCICVFVYLYFCICVFVRQIKVWAGLLVLAKVSNQNCHKVRLLPRCLPARWQIVDNEKF